MAIGSLRAWVEANRRCPAESSCGTQSNAGDWERRAAPSAEATMDPKSASPWRITGGFASDATIYDVSTDTWAALEKTPFALVTTPAVRWNSQIADPRR